VELERRHPKARTLFCSGYTANLITERGVFDEGVEFLAKPFTRDGLLTRVRAVLDHQ
jgi:hypothetical protein